MIKSILIATDGSANSIVATRYGCCLAGLFKAAVCGLNVVDIRSLEGPLMSDISGALGFEPFQSYLPQFEKILQQRSDSLLEDFQKLCAEHAITAEVKRLTGIVANVIAEEAKRVDLVVIAQHGEHAQWSSGLLGSTAQRLAAGVRDYVGHYGLDVAVNRLSGDAPRAILKYAGDQAFDMIVMGAFGHSRLHDLILGGTTAYMIRETTLPIMLIR